MRIEREQLVPTNAPLVGFGGTRVYPLGAVTLPVKMVRIDNPVIGFTKEDARHLHHLYDGGTTTLIKSL